MTKTAALLLFAACLLLPWPPAALAQPTKHLQAQYQQLADKYLVKAPDMRHHFRINQRGIAMYANRKAWKDDQPECLVYWDELAAFKNMLLHDEREAAMQAYLDKGSQRLGKAQLAAFVQQGKMRVKLSTKPKSGKPLYGRRIAIDPGHIAGDLKTARIEHRLVMLKLPNGQRAEFCEGDLTLTTAKLLKQKLEQAGADVMLTRNQPNKGARGITFHQWRKQVLPSMLKASKGAKMSPKHIDYLVKKAPDRDIYENYFLPDDLRTRASIVNAYQPDLTIIIHFNGYPFRRRQWDKPVSDNFNMAFTPGAFLRNELNQPEARFDFLRMLVLNNLEPSDRLCRQVVAQMEKQLQVPTIPTQNGIGYLKHNSILLHKGVYARNLGLSRLVNSPLCYGESLYQDNGQEAARLAQNQPGKPAPRLRQVAESYYQAILNYFSKKKA